MNKWMNCVSIPMSSLQVGRKTCSNCFDDIWEFSWQMYPFAVSYK